MSGTRLWSVAIAAVVLFTASARAQDQKNELAGLFGRTIISDQGLGGLNASVFNPFVRSGAGFSFQVNYARHVWQTGIVGLSAEVPVMLNPDEDLNSGANVVPSGYRQFFLTPSARLNLFPSTSVSPWVSIGGGFAHFSEASQLLYGGPNPGKSTNSGVLQSGVGLDVKLLHSLAIRGEFRDFWSGTPDLPLAATGKTRQHNYFVGLGVVWRF